MPRHYLGDRHQYTVRARVEADLDSAAAADGYSSVAQWLADLAYDRVGKPSLKQGPDQRSGEGCGEQLQLSA